MRLKIIDIADFGESDSDYDTAVEMSHYTMNCRSVLFETPGGVRFSVIAREEQTTHSYLEPDFDNVDSAGQAPYLSHRDTSKDTCSTTCAFSGLYIATPARLVLESEFRDAFRRHGDITRLQPGDEDLPQATYDLWALQQAWAVHEDEDLTRDVAKRVSAHLAATDGRPSAAAQHFCQHDDNLVTPNVIDVTVPRVEIEALAGIQARSGSVCDVILSEDLHEAVVYAEQLHAQVANDNFEIRNENNVRAAKARLHLSIEASVSAARCAPAHPPSGARPRL